MDVTKVKTAIGEAHKALNTLIDGEYKAKNFSKLRRLDLAAKALVLSEQHLDVASTPKKTAKAAKA